MTLESALTQALARGWMVNVTAHDEAMVVFVSRADRDVIGTEFTVATLADWLEALPEPEQGRLEER